MSGSGQNIVLSASHDSGTELLNLQNSAIGSDSIEALGIAINRVSVNSAGIEGNAASSAPAISGDGRYIAFRSSATNLVSGDTNNLPDIFVKDTVSGEIERVSAGTGGIEANGFSTAPTISADGRFVAFQSFASNLVSGDNNNRADIFVFDRVTKETKLVSAAVDGTMGNFASSNPVISANGQFVAFQSFAKNLVTGDRNGTADIFVKDLVTGTIELVSLNSQGVQGINASNTPTISGDGRYIAFASLANNLVQGDSNGVADIFIRDRQTNTTSQISVSTSGQQADNGTPGDPNYTPGSSSSPSISTDGRFVVFTSNANNLVNGDAQNTPDIFIRDLINNSTSLVSTSSDGTPGNAISSNAVISGQGRYVAFVSNADNLVAEDTPETTDVFLKDLNTGETKRISTNSTGEAGNSTSFSPSISNTGVVAFLSSASNLITGDTNKASDIFVYGKAPSFVVTNTLDSGAGSLRQAILDANNTLGTQTITFKIEGTGVQTINLASALPEITEAVTIDATTQIGFVKEPLIELNGSGIAGSIAGLKINSGNSTIKGFGIKGFQTGVQLAGDSNTITGNLISATKAVVVSSGTSNSIVSNEISYTEIGIDLGNDGITANDLGDGDTGANNLLNNPELLEAFTTANGGTIVKGKLNSTPNSTFKIQFFTKTTSDLTNSLKLFGETTVSTDATGNSDFSAEFFSTIPVGQFITTTASDFTNLDTSEFSQELAVTQPNSPPVLDLNGADPGLNYSATFTVGQGAISVVDSAKLSVTDADSANLKGATVKIANLLDGAAEVLSAVTTGTNITTEYVNGDLKLIGDDTWENYQKVLRSVSYNNNAANPNMTQRSLDFVINDGISDSLTATTTVSLELPVPQSVVNLGIVTGAIATQLDSINDNDQEKMYQLELTGTNNRLLIWSYITAGGNADVALYDSNNNFIQASNNTVSNDDIIDITGLNGGIYYLKVYQASAGESADYRLRIAALNV